MALLQTPQTFDLKENVFFDPLRLKHSEGLYPMNRFYPLKANATNIPTYFIDSHAAPNQLFEDACFRIRAAASLLEAFTSVTIRDTNDSDFYRLILPAYLLLQDGADTLEQITFKGSVIHV
jgi:superfamily I DNA/RNA helicase